MFDELTKSFGNTPGTLARATLGGVQGGVQASAAQYAPRCAERRVAFFLAAISALLPRGASRYVAVEPRFAVHSSVPTVSFSSLSAPQFACLSPRAPRYSYPRSAAASSRSSTAPAVSVSSLEQRLSAAEILVPLQPTVMNAIN